MTKIAFISDTHDNLINVRLAVDSINNQNPDLVVFLGDLCSPFTVSELEKLNSPLKGVFGNNDGDREAINKRLEPCNTQFQDFLELEPYGKKIACIHGTDREKLKELQDSGVYDVVANGHTHTKKILEKNGVLCLNPGEICGYLTGKPSYMILNTQNMIVEEIFL